jgi:hypothetical protein
MRHRHFTHIFQGAYTVPMTKSPTLSVPVGRFAPAIYLLRSLSRLIQPVPTPLSLYAFGPASSKALGVLYLWRRHTVRA